MRKYSKAVATCNTFILMTAAMLGLAIATSGLNPAAARITLNQCKAKYEACRESCYNPNDALPPGAQESICWRKCDENHAACVDASMGQIKASQGTIGGSSKPPKKVNTGGLTTPSGSFAKPAGPATPSGSNLQTQESGMSGTGLTKKQDLSTTKR